MSQEVRIFSDVLAIKAEKAKDFDVYSKYGETLDNSKKAV